MEDKLNPLKKKITKIIESNFNPEIENNKDIKEIDNNVPETKRGQTEKRDSKDNIYFFEKTFTLKKTLTQVEFPSKITDNLKAKSKFNIALRLLILFFLIISIPIHYFLSKSISKYELNRFINQISETMPKIYIDYKFFGSFIYWFIYIFSNSNTILIYIGILYIIHDPVVIFKISNIFSLGVLVVSVLRGIFKSFRPYWATSGLEIENCGISFSSPSLSVFQTSFYFVLVFFYYSKMISKKIKILLIILIIIIVSGVSILSIISLQNYVYQVLFAISFSLAFMSIAIMLDKNFNEFIEKMLKNKFKIRKYKIISSILTIILIMISILMNIFSQETTNQLFSIENMILEKMNKCNQDYSIQYIGLGVQNNIIEGSIFSSILGTVWGVSLVIENDINIWWKGSVKNKILKALISSLLIILIEFLLSLIDQSSFLVAFFVSITKNFAISFFSFGVVFLLFEKLKLNSKKNNSNNTQKKGIFEKSIFVHQKIDS